MIIEQIRYFGPDEAAEEICRARREVDDIRVQLGLPRGLVMLADPVPDDSPAVVWQCAYETEGHLAVAESAIAGSQEYGTARDHLATLVQRTEIEVYTADSEEPEG